MHLASPLGQVVIKTKVISNAKRVHDAIILCDCGCAAHGLAAVPGAPCSDRLGANLSVQGKRDTVRRVRFFQKTKHNGEHYHQRNNGSGPRFVLLVAKLMALETILFHASFGLSSPFRGTAILLDFLLV